MGQTSQHLSKTLDDEDDDDGDDDDVVAAERTRVRMMMKALRL